MFLAVWAFLYKVWADYDASAQGAADMAAIMGDYLVSMTVPLGNAIVSLVVLTLTLQYGSRYQLSYTCTRNYERGS